eukprot:TRINITY_DN779949_c0_g1_i1.p1 TRINITY_DN779949_c0_g1~~TRINITY_DN779949_c0_g1_i1.p1  ORF type:complete len:491 (-),score=139.12 TRINITY_DN779949_c0_g1_i1:162-1634(-)
MQFYSRGKIHLEIGITYDEKGKQAAAYPHYCKAAEYFITGCKYDKNPSTLKVMKIKSDNVLSRCEEIQVAMQNKETQKQQIKAAKEAEVVRPSTKVTDSVLWDEVIGMHQAKEALEESVILPREYPSLFAGKRQPWQSVLMHGPPGTGKTMLAKALAEKCGCEFFAVSSSDLISKWQGDSERSIKALFEKARNAKPAVIFMDEIDMIGRTRTDDESASLRRIKTELLKQLEGVGSDNSKILFLAATNRPWELDSALRRRFQRRIYIPLPTAPERLEMIKNSFADQHVEVDEDSFVNCALKTKGFSGSDIHVACREALMGPVRDCMNATRFQNVGTRKQPKYRPVSSWNLMAKKCSIWDIKDPSSVEAGPITEKHLEDSFIKAKSTVKTDDLKQYVDFANSFGVKDRESETILDWDDKAHELVPELIHGELKHEVDMDIDEEVRGTEETMGPTGSNPPVNGSPPKQKKKRKYRTRSTTGKLKKRQMATTIM